MNAVDYLMEASNQNFSTLQETSIKNLSHESENMNYEDMINSTTKKEPQEETDFFELRTS